jgi:hypothetical protein
MKSFIIYLCIFIGLCHFAQVTYANPIVDRFISREQVFSSYNFTCNPGPSSSGCSYHGTCTDLGNDCICDNGYITWYDSIDQNDQLIKCNYHQSSTALTCILHIIFGEFTGVGYFMIGQIGMGVGQLLLFWLSICLVCCVPLCIAALSDDSSTSDMQFKTTSVTGCFMCLWITGVIFWWIYSCIMIGLAKYTDKNGAPMPTSWSVW